jgi:hypothetical protein
LHRKFCFLLALFVVIMILGTAPISSFVLVLASDKSSEGPVELPPPRLDQSTEKVFNTMGAHIGDNPLTAEVGLPPSFIMTLQGNISENVERQILFTTPSMYNETATELFTKYAIPTYQIPDLGLNESVVFNPPTFVIRQIIDNDTGLEKDGFFTLTPVLDRVIPPITILVDKIANPENSSTKAKEIKFNLGKEGESVGFSFAVSPEIPEGLNVRPTSKFKTSLFLNIDYVGKQDWGSNPNETGKLNFSDPANFISSPEIIIGASKSLNTVKLDDGCPKLAAGLFNEQSGKWQPAKINRTQSLDASTVECSYKLQTEHFSKFAVGGVVPPAELQPS